jgi:hypothetical protein
VAFSATFRVLVPVLVTAKCREGHVWTAKKTMQMNRVKPRSASWHVTVLRPARCPLCGKHWKGYDHDD